MHSDNQPNIEKLPIVTPYGGSMLRNAETGSVYTFQRTTDGDLAQRTIISPQGSGLEKIADTGLITADEVPVGIKNGVYVGFDPQTGDVISEIGKAPAEHKGFKDRIKSAYNSIADGVAEFVQNVKENPKETAWQLAKVGGVVSLAGIAVGIPSKGHATTYEPYTTFDLGVVAGDSACFNGYCAVIDTEGGNIATYDSFGNRVGTIFRPDSITGIAYDSSGTLFAINQSGSKLYGNLGGDSWDLGLGINIGNSTSLDIKDGKFYAINKSGKNVAVGDMATGSLLSDMSLNPYLLSGEQALGVTVIDPKNQLNVAYLTGTLLGLNLNTEGTGIVSNELINIVNSNYNMYNSVAYDKSTHDMFMIDAEIIGGKAQVPITVVPEPVSSVLFVAGGAALGGLRLLRGRKEK